MQKLLCLFSFSVCFQLIVYLEVSVDNVLLMAIVHTLQHLLHTLTGGGEGGVREGGRGGGREEGGREGSVLSPCQASSVE